MARVRPRPGQLQETSVRMPLFFTSRARYGVVMLSLPLLACIMDPPEFPVAEPEPAPTPQVFPERVVEERVSPPVESAPVVVAVQEPKAPSPRKNSACDPGEFSEVPENVRSLVGLWKNEENGQLAVRSDRKGRLSLSYKAQGELGTWTASLALSKVGKRSDLEFLLTDAAVPDRRWRYEVNADGGRRLVGNVVETTLYADGDGPEDSLPQPVSLVRLCGPP